MQNRPKSDKHPGKRRQIGQVLVLTGTVGVLLICVLGLLQYGLSAWRTARIVQEDQAVYQSGESETIPAQAPGAEQEQTGSSGTRPSALTQFEVSFAKAAAEDSPQARSASLQTDPWPGNPSRTVSAALQKLQKQNRDVIGWLALPDCPGQAVVQRDNEYYLKRDTRRLHNANGALFLEESISLERRPDTYIIFGHNMKTGEMFGSLRLYEDVNYYRQNALITFNVLYEDGQYVVFSIADVDTVPGLGHYIPFMQLNGMEAEARNECIQKLKAFAPFVSPISVDADDQLLLLVTCEGSDTNRRVVAARRLREGESVGTVKALALSARKK